MSHELPVPQELQHLIEKRRDCDRRRQKRRSAKQRRTIDLGPSGPIDSAAGPAPTAAEERRTRSERRAKAGNRRKRPRRGNDPAPRDQ